VPRLMRTIQAEARAENVELDSLQPGQITLFKVAPEPTTSSTAPESTASDQPSKAAPAPTPSNLGQGVAPKNTGVAYVPLTLSGQGSYQSIQNLIARLEQQQRAFLITVMDVNRQTDTGAKGATRVHNAGQGLRPQTVMPCSCRRSCNQEVNEHVGVPAREQASGDRARGRSWPLRLLGRPVPADVWRRGRQVDSGAVPQRASGKPLADHWRPKNPPIRWSRQW
jgi:hypothetical protein